MRLSNRLLLIACVCIFVIVIFLGGMEKNGKNDIVADRVASMPVVPHAASELEVIANRGANNMFNEHTITAYEIAAQYGVDAIKIDLRMTKDHEIIAMHDKTLNRTTNGSGKTQNHTLSEIKQLETIDSFELETYHEEIPTLREIFETFEEDEHYYIETRLVDGDTVMEEPLIALLNEYNLLDPSRVTIQSFSQASLEKIRELAPNIRLTQLYDMEKFDVQDAIQTDFPVIGLDSTDVTQDIVNSLHDHDKEIHVFFTDEQMHLSEQERIIMYGVDGVFTDDIAFTKHLLQH